MHGTKTGNYARQVLEEQVMMGWEGIAKEARELFTSVSENLKLSGRIRL